MWERHGLVHAVTDRIDDMVARYLAKSAAAVAFSVVGECSCEFVLFTWTETGGGVRKGRGRPQTRNTRDVTAKLSGLETRHKTRDI